MLLHESIRAARQRAKFSGAKVAEMLNMSAQAYRRYERGEVVPNATTILQLAGLLGCSPTAVMQTGGVEDESPIRTNLQQFDLELKEGETLSLVINATVAPTQVAPKPRPVKSYKPKLTAAPALLENRKKA
tara:strand:+ start:567 stop:959 length:393 start_codon:yes stop_codon:yes gene_type:complete